MKIKQRTKNWLVLISAVLIFFVLHIFFALNLGSNVKANVKEGTISMVSSFLESEVQVVDDRIYGLREALLSYTPEQKGAYSSFAIDVSPAESTKDYSFDGDYLYCTNGEYEARVEVSSLFQLRKDIIYEYSIILPDGEEWSSDTCLDNGDCIPVELMMEKCGIKVVFHIPNSILTTPGEKGISLVVRNMIYVAVLFVVFTLAMAIYTFSREPFVANKNSKMIDRILSAVTEDFVFLVEVDVKTKIEKVFFVSSGPRPTWFSSGKVKYDENIKSYAEKIVAPEDRNRFLEFTEFNTLMEYFRNNNNLFTIEYDVVLDGERRRYQGKFTFNAQDSDEPKIYVGVRDITKIEEERTEYNRKLMDALAQAEEANKGKSYFLFNMSHDIRTPLNAIIGYSELAKMHLDDKGMLSGYIDKIQICGNQLLGLIGEVLDMAKIESGRLDLIEKPCLCQDLMNDVMIAVNESAEKKGLNFEASGNACHSVILCDKVKVQKILLNIISNAVKYTPKGGNVSLRVTETIRENENLSDFSFVVKDNGIGISKEFLPYVFNSFSRERNATLSGVSGTGLGMTITKRLVDAMGGKIEIESEQGKGTTVTVSITFHRLSGEEENKEEMTEDISLENKRVLLAEDNEINGEIASEMLRELKVNVDLVTDGKMCLEALESHDAGYYDVVLMDIQMPVMDGYEATRAIRRLSDKTKRIIPVIAMTANAFEEDKQKAFQSGMNGHLAKPVEMRHLIQAIQSVIKNKE